MLRVLIADDEAPARSRLKRLLQNCPGVEVIGEAANGVETLQKVFELKPRALFLDIEMPELTGLAVARSLGAEAPAIVFVTAYDQHALQAFELSAADYLVKPVEQSRLSRTIDKLFQQGLGRQQDIAILSQSLDPKSQSFRRFAVRTGNRFVVIDPARVSAVISRDHYSALLVDGREMLADDPLDNLIERLNPAIFLRVHRSAVINLEFLHELERAGDRKYQAVLADPLKTRVPVSRERLQNLRDRLGI